MALICKSKLITEYFNFDEHKTLYTDTREAAERLVAKWNKEGVKLDVAYILKDSELIDDNQDIHWYFDSKINVRFNTCDIQRFEVW